MVKVFDISTVKGIKAAERFQTLMYSLFNSVTVRPIGLNRVQIVAYKPITEK